MIYLLYGYDPGCQCIRGIQVLKLAETPGLGDRIMKDPAFLENFKALDARLDLSGTALLHPIVTVKHGSKRNPWEIDAISGATISSRAVGKAINLSARKILPAVKPLLDRISRLHPAIKGVWGAQTSGANIVSFNLDAFKSWCKEQGANAPVGERPAFAYTTALNHLLRKGSPQRLQVGDSSTVFWAEKPTEMETAVVDIFGEPVKDDPDRQTEKVRALFHSIHVGRYVEDDAATRFYVLGLAPNAARIAVRFWKVTTVGELAEHIVRHFEDIRIEHGEKQPEYLPLFRLLVSTATQGKADNISPNFHEALAAPLIMEDD